MATVPAPHSNIVLKTGDRMSRSEFHRLYEETPKEFKAELVGGVVQVASPLRRGHGTDHIDFGGLLFVYKSATPGVEAGDNATILLGDDSEPQPDLYLRILPEYGGQSQTDDQDYIVGPPELLVEISYSSAEIDLHAKYDDYSRCGVLEYLVACVDEKRLRWFDLTHARELHPEADHVIRVRTFPGLWIDVEAAISGDAARLLATLQAGLATTEHAEFVARLAEQRARLHPG